ncbi:binding-protein-dependent transport systems inner membrane component [Halothermothrix orenii H 168]|uniref:Binding-protein-dependent transport systems inner membrane component n=1 Tax=Halothermothrix orenii (strain H 168 / OCM 544 / DSM 9562) TaxID=373903 RepID=B8D046_HALOH|nr:sugar ABC transporter permease [Halothermothrix orenii]ACL68800.1 binding-protein-dependent transport systems inner membrane component [Halothermothrix orenii H 168]
MQKKWAYWKEKMAPYVLLAPFLFWFIIFFGYAFIRVVYFSFTKYNLFDPPTFVGFKNYLDLFREYLFGVAFRNTLMYSIIVTTVQTIFALILAVVMNQKIKGIRFFRAAYYMPSVTSSVVITLIFIWLFQRKGLINYLVTLYHSYGKMIGVFFLLLIAMQALLVFKEKRQGRPVKYLEPSYLVLSILFAAIVTYILRIMGYITVVDVKPVDIIWLNTREKVFGWLGPLSFARPLGAIMILNIWTTIPTFMLIYLAGLQDIPSSLYEAAEVDGANTWQKFRYVTIPQLRHITFLVVTLGLIGTLQVFDQIAIVGDQAPLESIVTLAYYVYRNTFPSSATPHAGMASAGAIVLALITLTLVLIRKKNIRRGERLIWPVLKRKKI